MASFAVLVDTYMRPSEEFIYRGIRALNADGVICEIYCLYQRGKGDLDIKPLRLPWPPSAWIQLMAGLITGHLKKMYRHFKGLSFIRRLFHTLRVYLWVQDLSREQRPKWLHAEFAGITSRYVRAAAESLDIPYTVAAHARDIRVPDIATGDILKNARASVFCSHALRNAAINQWPGIENNSSVVYHGIVFPDTYISGEKHTETLNLAAAGRFVEKKGFMHLIEACRLLKEYNIPFECVIAGSGEREGLLKEAIHDGGLQDCVSMPGFLSRSALDEIFCKADLLCVPSIIDKEGDTDGIPNVILEAGRFGLPVIAADIGGISEAVSDGINGYVIDMVNGANLARAIKMYWELTDAEKKSMRESAFEQIKAQFNVSDTSRQMLSFFQEYGLQV